MNATKNNSSARVWQTMMKKTSLKSKSQDTSVTLSSLEHHPDVMTHVDSYWVSRHLPRPRSQNRYHFPGQKFRLIRRRSWLDRLLEGVHPHLNLSQLTSDRLGTCSEPQ